MMEDIKRAISESILLMRHLISRDDIPLSLSLFSAGSKSVRWGQDADYMVALINNTDKPIWVRLLIDIYFKNKPVHPEGHHAYFEKMVFIPPSVSQEIRFAYNWKDKGWFEIKGVTLDPDHIWKGDCKINGRYFVYAILQDNGGRIIDQLTIVQEVNQ